MLLFLSISLVIYILFCFYMFKKFEKSENFMKDFDILIKVSKIIKNVLLFIIFIYIFWRFYSYFIYRPEGHVVYADTFKHLNDAVSHCMRRNVTLIDCTARRGIVPHQFTVKEPPFFITDIKNFRMVSIHHFFVKEDSSMFFSRYYENISKNIFGNAVNFYSRIVAPVRLYGTKGSQYVMMPIYDSLWPHLLTKDSIDSGVELLENKKLDPKEFENFLKEMERLSEIEKFANNLGDKLAKEIVDAKSRGEVIDFEKVVNASKNKK